MYAFSLGAKLNNPPKLMYGIFAWVGWPNIGPAVPGPAGPVPTALVQVIRWASGPDKYRAYFLDALST